MSGEIHHELEDVVESHVKGGDCAVHNGTRHAWDDRSSEPGAAAAAMVGAVR